MVARQADAEITLRRSLAVVRAVGALGLLLVSARADAQDARLVPFPASPLATVADGSASAVSTTFVASGSSWATRVPERSVFLARLQHVQRNTAGDTVPARGFDVRIGRGGQIYSWRGAFGEAVAPQYRAEMPPAHPEADFAPWVDEVWQSVVVNTALHSDAAPYFIHQAGVYRTDPLLRGPFFSPTLVSGPGAPPSSFVVVDWSQHAHIPTRWRSGLVTYTQYRDVGAGILEVTLVGYNAGPDILNRWNAPWGGVRSSSLPVEEVSVGGRLVTIAPGIAWGTDADVRASTDGYALFRTDAGDAALAAVFGPDRAASLGPAQWRNTLVRTGKARPDARDLRAFTVIRPVTVPVGEAFWARWYFVVGSRTAVLSVLDAYGLVQRAAYGVLRIAPGDSALLSYAVAAAGTAVAVPDVAAARFVLRALPVAGSVPLYPLVRENGTQVLSPSPYALSDPPYNGATTRWELLGYAFEAERSTWPRRRLMAGAPMPRARTPRALGVGAARRDRAVGAPSLWCSPRRSSRDAGAAKPRGRRRLRRGRGGRGSLRRTTRPPRSEGCGASPPVPARTRGVKGLPCGHRAEELLSGMLAQSPREGRAAAGPFLRHRGGPCPRQHARTPRYRLDAAWCIIAAMAGDPAQATLSYTAYLALERDTDQRHEWLRGEVWAMAGGSPTHAALAAAILRELGLLALEHGCTAYSSDLKVRVDLTDLSTYPDAAVLCGPVVASPVDALAVTNPTVLVEVLSDSTERYDRGDKWQHYKRLDTLQHYLLVSQRSRHLELFSREAGRWLYTDATEGESLALPGLGGTLSVDRVYRGIALAGDDPR